MGCLLAWTLEFKLHKQLTLGETSGIWACSGAGMARAGAAARMDNHGKQCVPEGRQDSPRGLQSCWACLQTYKGAKTQL